MATTIDRVTNWNTADNPEVLLNMVWPHLVPYRNRMATFSQGLPGPLLRRLRLFGAACARMVWSVLTPDARNAVLLSERFADDPTVLASLRAATVRMTYTASTYQQQAANAAGWAADGEFRGAGHPDLHQQHVWNPCDAGREAAMSLATRAAGPAPAGGSPVAKSWQAAWNGAFFAAREHQAELVRDVFPPPGYATPFPTDLRTDTVLALARQMDATGDFSPVPILADALQDAGCTDDVALGRCRAPSGIHSRGNWVVDLVLGRA